MNRWVRAFVNLGFLAALIVLAANAILTYANLETVAESRRWVAHTRQVIGDVRRTLATLTDAETGQRGYLLTGREDYLQPYGVAIAELDAELNNLANLTTDNARQKERIAELRRIAGEKMAELDLTIKLRRSTGLDAALQVVLSDQGKRLMDQGRRLAAEMEQDEEQLLAERDEAARIAHRRTVVTFTLATALALLLLVLALYLKSREEALRERAAELIRQSESWLSTTLTSIGDAVIATDGLGRVKFLNPIAEILTGWTPQEAAGRLIHEVFNIVNETTRQPTEHPVDRVIRDGVIVGLANHTIVIARDGTETAIEDSAAPIKDAAGSVVGVVMVFQDATERRRHEKALRKSEERHRVILESITDAFYALDHDWRFTYVNRQAELFMNRDRADLLGKVIWEEYSTTVGTVIESSFRRAVAENVAVTFETHFAPHDHWYEAHAYPSTDGLSVYFQDVGGRKRAEQENARLMAVSEQLRRTYETALSNSPDFNYVFDLEGRFAYINESLLSLLQKRLDEAVGKNFFDLGYPPDLAERLQRQIRQVIETQATVRDETAFTSYLGERMYEYIFVPVVGAGGAVDAVVGSTRDITDRRRVEDEIRAAKKEAEDANRAKDDFLAVLSHELRTPLNPILLATTAMLDRPTLTGEIRPTLEMISQNVSLQARLIDDLLDVMRIVRGKMPLHWGISDCHDLIDRATEICRSDVHSKSQRLTSQLDAGDHCVNADAARLQQVLWNLIKNAIKFTPEGGTIAIRSRNEGDHIVIEVADTGIGIESDILPHVFDAFHQGDSRITRKFGGLGLGLAICRGVVEAHGGSITAESPGRDRGTTFRIVLKTMPVPKSEPDCSLEGKGSSIPISFARMSILLVEDEPTTLRLLSSLLGGLGHRVMTASTVADAWETFQGDRIDLIVSDVGLPDGTGLDLMRRVKTVRPVPAIALTGYGMDEDIRRSREAGFTTHMTKPIDFTKLEAMIRQVAPTGP